jgi:hypothetical protein
MTPTPNPPSVRVVIGSRGPFAASADAPPWHETGSAVIESSDTPHTRFTDAIG